MLGFTKDSVSPMTKDQHHSLERVVQEAEDRVPEVVIPELNKK